MPNRYANDPRVLWNHYLRELQSCMDVWDERYVMVITHFEFIERHMQRIEQQLSKLTGDSNELEQ